MQGRRLCHYTKDNGQFCGSPAVRGQSYCYYHVELVRRRRRLATMARAKQELAAAQVYEDQTLDLISYGQRILARLAPATPVETGLCTEPGEEVPEPKAV